MASTAVKDFYKGKNVFLTGGTGFVGIAVIEKLLRCTEVSKIYLLVRPKKGKNASERLEEIKKNSVFGELIKSSGTDVFNRLVTIGGDVGEENLGLSPVDRQTLIDNVHLVFHSAATLDFGANLKTTVNINLVGTKRIVELCHEIRDLKALLHVSSAYVNSHMLDPEEKIYPVPKSAKDVIEFIQTSTDLEIEEKTPEWLGEYINAYTFTKALAEHEVAASISSFPSTIVRPSQIIAAWKEPIPGWTISKNGPQGFLMGAVKGVVRRLPVDKTLICDYIPVDVVINGIIVGAWHAAESRPTETSIFHITSSTVNPFRWNDIAHLMELLLHKYPLKGAVWYPYLKQHSTIFMFKLSSLLFHWIPAFLLDTVARISGGRPILVRMHTNITNSLAMLDRFIYAEWKYDAKKTMELHKKLGAEDQETFGLDITKLVWAEFFENMALGVRTYLHNEKPESLGYARKKDKVLKILNILVQVAFISLVWTIVTALTGTTYGGTMFTFLPLLTFLYSIL